MGGLIESVEGLNGTKRLTSSEQEGVLSAWLLLSGHMDASPAFGLELKHQLILHLKSANLWTKT